MPAIAAADPTRQSTNRLTRLAIATIALALIIAPFIFEPADMYDCWLPWMRATRGLYPWRAYSITNCNYPPFMLYVWTACETVERLAHQQGRARFFLAVTLVKLPNLLAYVAGAMVCVRGLRSVVGATAAKKIAAVYLLCLPIWFNAAVWGQCDAMLSLAMLAAVVATLNNRPVFAGACVGWALAIKLQAIVIIPAIAVFALRTFGLRRSAQIAITAGLVLAGLILPMVLAGYGHAVRLSYSGAVGLYPYLSIDTFNPWSLVTLFNLYVRHLPGNIATSDGQLWFGIITPRQIGLLLFASFTLWLMVGLYQRPTRCNFILTAGLTAYGFFMLSTQMHERYIIPAAALLTVCATSGAGRIYLAIMIPALLNQIKGMAAQLIFRHSDQTTIQQIVNKVTLPISSVNLCLFIWICVMAHAQMRQRAEKTFNHRLHG